MSDFTTRARETAKRIATERGEQAFNLVGFRIEQREKGIVDGFAEAVSRLPSEEEIAAVLHHVDCGCGDGVDHDDPYPRQARAVLDLIEKRLLANTNQKGDTQ